MCKLNKWGDTRIDPCMRMFITNLNLIKERKFKIKACCCGHGKYRMTIIIDTGYGIYDLVSGHGIPRKKKFYKRDKQGHYYIPETLT